MLNCCFKIFLKTLGGLGMGLAVQLESLLHIFDILIETACNGLEGLSGTLIKFFFTSLEHLLALCRHLGLYCFKLLGKSRLVGLLQFCNSLVMTSLQFCNSTFIAVFNARHRSVIRLLHHRKGLFLFISCRFKSHGEYESHGHEQHCGCNYNYHCTHRHKGNENL